MCGSSPFSGQCLLNRLSGRGWLLATPLKSSPTCSGGFISKACLSSPHLLSYSSCCRDPQILNLPNRKRCLESSGYARTSRIKYSTCNTQTNHGLTNTDASAPKAVSASSLKQSEDNNLTGLVSNDDARTHVWKWKRKRPSSHIFDPIHVSRAQVESELLRLSHCGTSVRDDLADLLINEKVKPELQHYEALILENSDTLYGSAGNVRNLLEECAEQEIPRRQTIFAAAFRALAVHSDPLLLADILHACNTQWISLDRNSLYFVAITYLRSGQIELAQECMARIYDEFGEINVWLYVLLIRQLVEQADWEAILRICHELQDDHMRQVSIPSNFWHWLLLEATEVEDVAMTKWIWNLWVERAWIVPQETTILKVLHLAANNGLPKLAQSAANILKHSGTDEGSEIKFFTEASSLVQKAYANAGLSMPPVQILNRKGGTMWWLFKDNGGHLGKLRIDPWTAIHSSPETKNVWPNIRNHLDQKEKTKRENPKVYDMDTDALECEVLYVGGIDPEELLHADDQELGWIDTQLPVPMDIGLGHPELFEDNIPSKLP